MTTQVSPIGAVVSDHIKECLGDSEFRVEHERLAPCEALARLVIKRRGALGLSQGELAALMGTTASTVSRIESGQHAVTLQTLKKLADAFGSHVVFGFEFGSAGNPERELVVL